MTKLKAGQVSSSLRSRAVAAAVTGRSGRYFVIGSQIPTVLVMERRISAHTKLVANWANAQIWESECPA